MLNKNTRITVKRRQGWAWIHMKIPTSKFDFWEMATQCLKSFSYIQHFENTNTT